MCGVSTTPANRLKIIRDFIVAVAYVPVTVIRSTARVIPAAAKAIPDAVGAALNAFLFSLNAADLRDGHQ